MDENKEKSDNEERDHIPGIADEIIEKAVNRERGLFTKSDREFLFGLKRYDYEQSAINKRRDIRNRLQEGVKDLQLLRKMTPEERAKFFDTIEKGVLHESVANFIAFLYSGLNGSTIAIEQMVESGLFKAERGGVAGYEGGARNVDVTIDLTIEYDADEIYQRFKNSGGDGLTPAEIGVLVREGRLSANEYDELAWNEEERPRNTPAETTDQWYFD
ncbi:hypothetical protein [Salinigranum sp. GCM10025319]|uniref:hypothetical protein n=1 Tax=Salinigranum sp. GCM10025319 TaxID=3252687 RepID=UPI0036113726